MKLSQLMKKGYVQVEQIDEEITRLCSAYGILKEKRLYMTGICANKSMASGMPINVFDYVNIPKDKLKK